MKIILFPYAKAMREEKPHPKNYPWWPELVQKLQDLGHTLIQVGVESEPKIVSDFRPNLNFEELTRLVRECDTWIGVDSFGQHFCWDLGVKGIALFGQSDPNIFGHPENINLLKSREYLRDQQFWMWEQAEFKEDAFVEPDVVIDALNTHFN